MPTLFIPLKELKCYDERMFLLKFELSGIGYYTNDILLGTLNDPTLYCGERDVL